MCVLEGELQKHKSKDAMISMVSFHNLEILTRLRTYLRVVRAHKALITAAMAYTMADW
jgi:hypothetical protein